MFTLALAIAASGPPNAKIAQIEVSHTPSEVHRIYDKDTGIVCYVVPARFCHGDCAYGPAISCLPLPAKEGKP